MRVIETSLYAHPYARLLSRATIVPAAADDTPEVEGQLDKLGSLVRAQYRLWLNRTVFNEYRASVRALFLSVVKDWSRSIETAAGRQDGWAPRLWPPGH